MTLKSLYNQTKPTEDSGPKKLRAAKHPRGLEDSQLWVEFQSGNEMAYAKIYQDNANGLYCYGLKLVKDSGLIQDCIQDLFVEIWNNKHRLGQVRSIKSYLFKALRRKILSEATSRRKHIDFDYYGDYKDSKVISGERKLIEKQEFDLQLQKLKKVMDKLTHKQREVIYLKYYSQLSYPEMAEVMGLSIKGTYKLVGRAIHVLRKHWIDF